MTAPAIDRDDAAKRNSINIRISNHDRDIIDRAAEAAGKSRSEFMLEAARTAATDALLDQTHFFLAPADFERFRAALDEPPAANEGLRDLMRRPAPWETIAPPKK